MATNGEILAKFREFVRQEDAKSAAERAFEDATGAGKRAWTELREMLTPGVEYVTPEGQTFVRTGYGLAWSPAPVRLADDPKPEGEEANNG